MGRTAAGRRFTGIFRVFIRFEFRRPVLDRTFLNSSPSFFWNCELLLRDSICSSVS